MAGGGGSNRTAAPNLLVYALTAPLFACQVNNHINNSSLSPYAPLAGGWAGERDEVVPCEACLPKKWFDRVVVRLCPSKPCPLATDSCYGGRVHGLLRSIGAAGSPELSPTRKAFLWVKCQAIRKRSYLG